MVLQTFLGGIVCFNGKDGRINISHATIVRMRIEAQFHIYGWQRQMLPIRWMDL